MVVAEHAYGWLNLLSKKIVIYSGLNIGDVVDKNADNITGIRVDVHPVKGLDIFYALPVIGNMGNGDQFVLGSLPNIFSQSRFGAKYANDKLTVQAIFKLGGLNGTLYYQDPTSGKWTHDKLPIDLDSDGTPDVIEQNVYLESAFGVKVPVGPAKIDLTAAFGTVENAGYLRIGPKVEFATGKVNAWGQANMQFAFDGKPQGDWTNNQITKSADDAVVGFELGFGYQITDLLKAELALGSDNAAYFDGSGLWVKPKVAFSFGPNVEFAVWDQIGNIGADKDVITGGSGTVSDPYTYVGRLKNIVQIEIVWKF
jgi:hypothetical protein